MTEPHATSAAGRLDPTGRPALVADPAEGAGRLDPADPTDPTDPTGLTDQLPDGWHLLPIPGVERTVLIGTGGLVVLVTRATGTGAADRRPSAPWNGVERRRPSGAQVVAELVSQLLHELCDVELPCHPVVVLADDDTRLLARLDEVPVLHRRRLGEWLARQPRRLDRFTVTRVVETVTGARPTHRG